MKNPTIALISSILSVILLIVEIIFMIQLNISRGIKKTTIVEIIDNMNIQAEISKTDEYKKIKAINPIISEKIIKSDEFEKYTKENIKALYLNLFYSENNPYIKSDELKQFVDKTLEENQSETFTEIEKEQILDKIESIIYEMDNTIDEIQTQKTNVGILEIVLSPITNYIILIVMAFIILILIAINKLKESLIWIGVPTIISGILFFMLLIELKTNLIVPIIYQKLINDITSTLKISSITMIIIGLVLITLYTIKKYQKESETNGEI